jgi:hypothetical protein
MSPTSRGTLMKCLRILTPEAVPRSLRRVHLMIEIVVPRVHVTMYTPPVRRARAGRARQVDALDEAASSGLDIRTFPRTPNPRISELRVVIGNRVSRPLSGRPDRIAIETSVGRRPIARGLTCRGV